jgi:signal transduction histidine kinase
MGIASDELKHIFEPFYRGASVQQTQIHGSGLGLPLARSIAESMGGTLTVDSEVGKGSCFTMRLPAHFASIAEREVASESQMIRVSPGLR